MKRNIIGKRCLPLRLFHYSNNQTNSPTHQRVDVLFNVSTFLDKRLVMLVTIRYYELEILQIYLLCKKQSYLKQRRQNNVWKECRVCSCETLSARTSSIFGVHSGGH